VLCEVYGSHPGAVRCSGHVVLALVLYKLVDANQEVREDAMHMLHVLSQREWQHGGGGGGGAEGAEGADSFFGTGAGGGGGPGGTAAGGRGLTSSRNSRGSLAPAGGSDHEGPAGGGGGGEEEGGAAVVVLGSLQDSYQQFQYQLSYRLARDHPELSEALCEEVMTRQLQCDDGLAQHPMLTSLAPWMENLAISFPWRGNW
ncbi:hypothetical protein TSOC_014680, partial [Tetrabaena socialis]